MVQVESIACFLRSRAAWNWPASVGKLLLALAGLAGASCGGSDNAAPVATAASIQATEDVEVSSILTGSDADGDQLRFRLSSLPRSGVASVNELSGALAYRGVADFNGEDEFTFSAIDSSGAASAPARVTVMVAAVNDAPRIAPIADGHNSPDTFEVSIGYSVMDPDGDPFTVSVSVDETAIVDAVVDTASSSITLHPGEPGQAAVSLQASDAFLSSTESFLFSVGAVTKTRNLSAIDAFSSAIEISNDGPRDVHFQLRHNDASLAVSVDDLIAEALADQPANSGAVAERLWAYVNNNTYHWHSLTSSRWVHDPLILLNSVGFGLCDDAASALVLLGRALGLEAHVWALEGHVIAELGTAGTRGVYDPDLSVFYRDDAGAVADVGTLASDTTLITSPRNPVLPGALGSFAYSPSLATIYGSLSDNFTHDWYVETASPNPGMLRLPPGASLKYPGVWAGPPRSTAGEGVNTPVFANMLVTLPAGWTGVIEMPLVLKAMHGAGRVRVGTGEYEIADSALAVSLDVSPNWIASIDIVRSDTPIELVFLLNPLRFGVMDNVRLALTGIETWPLRVSVFELPEANRRTGQPTDAVRKPTF